MPDSRRARRANDPGMQPERTSLAWFRTLLGYGVLVALTVKHRGYHDGATFCISLTILVMVMVILWGYTRNRHLMDVARSDFSQPCTVRDKLLISLGVFFLALLFAATHIQKILLFFKEIA